MSLTGLLSILERLTALILLIFCIRVVLRCLADDTDYSEYDSMGQKESTQEIQQNLPTTDEDENTLLSVDSLTGEIKNWDHYSPESSVTRNPEPPPPSPVQRRQLPVITVDYSRFSGRSLTCLEIAQLFPEKKPKAT